MKKCLLILLTSLSFYSINAQVAPEKSEEQVDDYNRWTIEGTVGSAKGIAPFDAGYFSSKPNTLFGAIQVNSFGLAARKMISPIFGFRVGLNYDQFTDQNATGSLDFSLKQYRGNFEGVVNGARLFNIQDVIKRFGLLFHGGFQLAAMHSSVYDLTELNGGLIIGVTPQYRVTNRLAVTFDLSYLHSWRQHFNWNGTNAAASENLIGSMFTNSIGVSYSLGKNDMHGDWAIISDKNAAEVEALKAKINEIENALVDTDQDNVPDSLDLEKNSLPLAVVDSKGRMIDLDKDGVADSVEQYVTNIVNNGGNTNINNNTAAQLINDGYVYAYFDFDVRQPNISSTDNIGFILNYLKQNTGKSVEIIGYADELGTSDYNDKLSNDRAENVKQMLVDAGIDASRLNVTGSGVDNSVNKDNEYSRRLVRKVMFKIK